LGFVVGGGGGGGGGGGVVSRVCVCWFSLLLFSPSFQFGRCVADVAAVGLRQAIGGAFGVCCGTQ
jgi:hypothetical protein